MMFGHVTLQLSFTQYARIRLAPVTIKSIPDVDTVLPGVIQPSYGSVDLHANGAYATAVVVYEP